MLIYLNHVILLNALALSLHMAVFAALASVDVHAGNIKSYDLMSCTLGACGECISHGAAVSVLSGAS